MALLNNWNPVAEIMSMREAINRLFDQAVVRPGFNDGVAMPFDIVEQGDTFLLRVAAPGLDPQSIQITVDRGLLTLTGRRSLYAPEEAKQYTWHARGLSEGEVRLTTTLPAEVDADHAQASYEYGIVTVRLPKAEAARAKVIQVTAGSGQKQLAAAAS